MFMQFGYFVFNNFLLNSVAFTVLVLEVSVFQSLAHFLSVKVPASQFAVVASDHWTTGVLHPAHCTSLQTVWAGFTLARWTVCKYFSAIADQKLKQDHMKISQEVNGLKK